MALSLTRTASEQFESLSRAVRQAVGRTMDEIEVRPREVGVKLGNPLRGKSCYRVGFYRIVYRVERGGRSPRVVVMGIRETTH